MMLIIGALIGIIIGLISGLVGIGGGALLVPALIYFYKMTQHKAQGTSLAILLRSLDQPTNPVIYKLGSSRSIHGN